MRYLGAVGLREAELFVGDLEPSSIFPEKLERFLRDGSKREAGIVSGLACDLKEARRRIFEK